MTTEDPTEPYRNQIVRFAEEITRLTAEAKAKDEAHAAEVARLHAIASAGLTPELFVRDAFIDNILTGRRTPGERMVTETVTLSAAEYAALTGEINHLRKAVGAAAAKMRYLLVEAGLPDGIRNAEKAIAGDDALARTEYYLRVANRESGQRRSQIKKLQKRLAEVEAERDRAVAMAVGPAADALTQQRLQRTARSAASSPQPTRNRGRDSFRPVAGAR